MNNTDYRDHRFIRVSSKLLKKYRYIDSDRRKLLTMPIWPTIDTVDIEVWLINQKFLEYQCSKQLVWVIWPKLYRFDQIGARMWKQIHVIKMNDVGLLCMMLLPPSASRLRICAKFRGKEKEQHKISTSAPVRNLLLLYANSPTSPLMVAAEPEGWDFTRLNRCLTP